MKRYTTIFLSLCVACGVAQAQDSYEAAEFAASDLNGTARYVGMGGALSALGGDITTMGTNPAGTALFRHNEVSATVGGIFTDEKGQLGHDASRLSFDQMGIIFVMDQGNRSGKGLQSVNFGVNYLKRRNFHQNIHVGSVEHLNEGFYSQTGLVADVANLCMQAEDEAWLIDGERFTSEDWAVLADIYAPYFDQTTKTFGTNGVMEHDGTEFVGPAAQSAFYYRNVRGATSQFDFNLSFNVSDRFFWGLSLGVYDLDFKRQTLYGETNANGNYDILNWYDSKGSGFDIKLGLICRPVEESPFRIGFTIHTPTWYSMDDVNGWSLLLNGKSPGNGLIYYDTDQADPFRYSYRTPWKFGVSLGHTIGRELAFGVEYEFTDPSSARYYTKEWEKSPYFNYVNKKTDQQLKAQHTVRMGVEYKPAPEFAIRVGYNFVSSPYKSDAYRNLDFWYDTYQTETAYVNWSGLHRFTVGFGYRFKGGYFDVAGQIQSQKGDFYAFDGGTSFKATEINNNRSQIMATLGLSF